MLRRAQGQLRLYLLLGAVGGGVLFFTAFSPFLRPVWDFWVDTGIFAASDRHSPAGSGKFV